MTKNDNSKKLGFARTGAATNAASTFAKAQAAFRAADAALQAHTGPEDIPESLGMARHDARETLFGTPAPDGAALAFKLAALAELEDIGEPEHLDFSGPGVPPIGAHAIIDGDDNEAKAFLACYFDALALSGVQATVAQPAIAFGGSYGGQGWEAYHAALTALVTRLNDEEEATQVAGGTVPHLYGAEEMAALDEEFFGGPCRTAADAAARLRFVGEALTAGDTGREPQVLESVAGFIRSDPRGSVSPELRPLLAEYDRTDKAHDDATDGADEVRAANEGREVTDADEQALADASAASHAAYAAVCDFTPRTLADLDAKLTVMRHHNAGFGLEQELAGLQDDVLGLIDPPVRADPDAELLELGEELERRWTAENAPDLSDEAADQTVEHSGEIARKIMDTPAQTAAGYRVKARAIAWAWDGVEEAVKGPADSFEAGQLIESTSDQFTRKLLAQLLGVV